MSDAAERLFSIRTALLQWLYGETLAGQHGSTLPGAASGTAIWPDPFPTRPEMEAAAAWLADKRYAVSMGSGPSARFRLTPEGEAVARSAQGISRQEPPSSAPAAATVYNLTGRDINFANNSPHAQRSAPPQSSSATWTGSIAGIIGVVVAIIGVVIALLAWSPWDRNPNPPVSKTTPTLTPTPPAQTTFNSIPFTFSTLRELYSCSSPHIFQKTIDALGPPPKDEKDWPSWVRANNGIDSGFPDETGAVTSRLLITVRGRDARPVTLTGLRVEAVNRIEGGIVGTSIKRACGSPTSGRYAEVNLDAVPLP